MQVQLQLFPEDRIMNPDHPRWLDFLSCMNHPALCKQFTQDKVNPSCDGTPRFTRRLLESFPDTDVEGSLEFFSFWGGVCDCTICEKFCWRLPEDWRSQEKALRAAAALKKEPRGVRSWVQKIAQKIFVRPLVYGQ